MWPRRHQHRCQRSAMVCAMVFRLLAADPRLYRHWRQCAQHRRRLILVSRHQVPMAVKGDRDARVAHVGGERLGVDPGVGVATPREDRTQARFQLPRCEACARPTGSEAASPGGPAWSPSPAAASSQASPRSATTCTQTRLEGLTSNCGAVVAERVAALIDDMPRRMLDDLAGARSRLALLPSRSSGAGSIPVDGDAPEGGAGIRRRLSVLRLEILTPDRCGADQLLR
jgi:hypothetical protein